MILVESGGLKKEHAWYVESVTVTDEAGVKWACSYRQWLSLYHTDCQVRCGTEYRTSNIWQGI